MKISRLLTAACVALGSLVVACAAPSAEPAPTTTVADQSDPIGKDIVIDKVMLSAERETWVFRHRDAAQSADRMVVLVDKGTGKPVAMALEAADTTYPVQTKIGGKGGSIAGFPRGASPAEAGVLLEEAWTMAGKPTALDLRPQASDGCTMSPDGWWVSCCDRHDACYESCGGRSKCDSQFYSCMDAMTGGSLTNIAEVYYVAVRTFGWMHYDC